MKEKEDFISRECTECFLKGFPECTQGLECFGCGIDPRCNQIFEPDLDPGFPEPDPCEVCPRCKGCPDHCKDCFVAPVCTGDELCEDCPRDP